MSITASIQAKLDRELPGWTVANYAVVVGIERLSTDGEEIRVDTNVALYAPDGQHPYVTDGLLLHADRICERKASE